MALGPLAAMGFVRLSSVMASAAEGFNPLLANHVVTKLRWVQPAAQLDGALVQKASEPKGRGLLNAGKVVLLAPEHLFQAVVLSRTAFHHPCRRCSRRACQH